MACLDVCAIDGDAFVVLVGCNLIRVCYDHVVYVGVLL